MADTGSEASSSQAVGDPEDVRLKYLEARRNEETFQGMVIARHVAEAVCAALGAQLTGDQRTAFEGKDLSGRLGLLEDKARRKQVNVPRAIVAALRTLQAYGNYASHYAPGDHQPPPRAAASAMASLALVAQWFLDRETEAPSGRTGLPLRDPPAGRPGWFERRVLSFDTDTSVPRLDGDPRFEIREADPSGTQLGALYAHHELVVGVCKSVCRTVLARESSVDPESMTLDQLSMLMSQLSDARPSIVPRAVCRDLEEVERRLVSVRRAIQQNVEDAHPFVLEARQRSPAEHVATWFRRDYLGQGWLERNWFRAGFLIVLSLGVLTVVWESSAVEARRLEDRRVRQALLKELCADPQTESSPVCARLHELAPKPSASAAHE